MQFAVSNRKWFLIAAAAVYLAVGILMSLRGEQVLSVMRRISSSQNLDGIAQSPPVILTQPSWTVTDGDEAHLLRFAVIGDYGTGEQPEADVAARVKSWSPAFIITTGDNNYPDGAQATIDQNIGQFFHEYIFPYQGEYGDGGLANRFFPSLGNHDWQTEDAQPYLDYFALPGNERYYEFVWGPIHFFALDSDTREPDGADLKSAQADWLQSRLAVSVSPWKIVYMHHPPYSSGLHGSITRMQWPFASWGADVVIAGHDHTYERISRDGIIYFINGLGGRSKYPFWGAVGGSQVRYNQDYGAMLVEASEDNLRFQFVNRQGELIDSRELARLKSYLYLPVIYQLP
jgi:tartrate-resistant acid phosphatase type 5